jgi:hypothetical protein
MAIVTEGSSYWARVRKSGRFEVELKLGRTFLNENFFGF